MRILYFAWLRERVGLAEETVTPPADVRDVASLLAWLRSRGGVYDAALADPSMVRVAVNQDYARPHDPVAAGDEIALFPPVTGG
jgi:sulfur-carrier protein